MTSYQPIRDQYFLIRSVPGVKARGGGSTGFLGCFLRYTLYESAWQGGSIKTDAIDVACTVCQNLGVNIWPIIDVNP